MGLQEGALGPDRDVSSRRQIALLPALVLALFSRCPGGLGTRLDTPPILGRHRRVFRKLRRLAAGQRLA
jgi:hypothetical protein